MIEFISIAAMCRTFQCLPDEGGLLDQNPLIMEKLAIIYQAQNDKDELDLKIEEANRNRPQGLG